MIPSSHPPETVSGTVLLSKPKRALNCYNLFFRYHRLEIKHGREFGRPGFKGVAQTIAARWKAVSPEEKAYFDHLAQLDKERHARELEAYNLQQGKLRATNTVTPVPFPGFNQESLESLAESLGEDGTELFIRLFR